LTGETVADENGGGDTGPRKPLERDSGKKPGMRVKGTTKTRPVTICPKGKRDLHTEGGGGGAKKLRKGNLG